MPDENSTNVRALLRDELLRLARLEDELAAAEAVSVPYWAPLPVTVVGHRMAAVALRADADPGAERDLRTLGAPGSRGPAQ